MFSSYAFRALGISLLAIQAPGQQRILHPRPITTTVKDAGVYNLAADTWTRGLSAAALAGPEVLYDNTCTSGYYAGMTEGDNVFDSGRIPSTSSPTNTSSLTGLYDAYEIDGFQIGYCSFEPNVTTLTVSFVDSYAACGGGGILPTPIAAFNLVNVPAGTSAGGQGCWLVGIDLTNSTLTFNLGGDGDGTYSNTPSTDSFGWSWTQSIPTTGSDSGPLLTGDPLGFFANSALPCTPGVGGGTTFVGGSGLPGSGIGALDQMEIGDGPTAPGCYWFGGYSATNPYTSFFLQLQGGDGGFGQCVSYESYTACPLGAATVTVQASNLRVGNIGSSGNDGVTFDMGAGTGEVHMGLQPLSAADHPGAVLVLEDRASTGQVDSITLTETGGEWLSTPDFSQLGSATYTLSLFNQGQLVYEQAGMIGPALLFKIKIKLYRKVTTLPDGTKIKEWCFEIGGGNVNVVGQGLVVADMFTITSEPVGPMPLDIKDVSIRAQSLSTDIVINSIFEPDSPGSAFCFGDGTGTSCPCGNTGDAGAGCANASGNGAVLTAHGQAGFGKIDTLRFDVSGVNGVKPGLLLRGDNQLGGGNGILAGDGLICLGGSSMRSQLVFTDASGSAIISDWNGNQFGTVANVGVATNFQYWYRDPMGSPCGNAFNFSNAWAVTYTP